jgi:hypothetical protein
MEHAKQFRRTRRARHIIIGPGEQALVDMIGIIPSAEQ